MTYPKLRFAVVYTVAAMVLAVPCAAADTRAVSQAIDQVAKEAVAQGISPGLQIAIFRNNMPVLVHAYGSADLELQVPVTNDSVFRIGSLTKQFTAAALLQLQEEGKISLDDKLSKYVPNFPRGNDITLNNMLHHTSGIHNYTDDDGFFEKDGVVRRTTQEMLAFLSAMPKAQDFEPGESFNYSNSAYFILGAVIEKVEGAPLGAVFERRFFKPLKMAHTAVDDERDIVIGRVDGYDGDGRGNFKNASFISMSIPGGAGSLRSSATDLVRWNTALFGGKILKRASFAAMTTPGKLSNGQSTGSLISKIPGLNGVEYGYGMMISKLGGSRKVFHLGGINGFDASLSQFPDQRLTVVILSNAIGKGVGASKISERVERIALGVAPK